MTEIVLVTCKVPDAACAETIAHALVERRLAACVNILAPCRSIYRWKGIIEATSEVPLLIKTTASRFDALSLALRELHPYEVPEIIALPVSAGLPAYLDWVCQETRVE